ncbi:MAG: hypothetical protein ISS28_08000 [Candidatus Cloacimonetes bacterium]|nr:hypothetical protein [Candidatus Cloacimonadota bacterium]
MITIYKFLKTFIIIFIFSISYLGAVNKSCTINISSVQLDGYSGGKINLYKLERQTKAGITRDDWEYKGGWKLKKGIKVLHVMPGTYYLATNLNKHNYKSKQIKLDSTDVVNIQIDTDNSNIKFILENNYFNYNNIHLYIKDGKTGNPIPDVAIGIQDDLNQLGKYIGNTDSEGKIDLGISHLSVVIFVLKAGYLSKVIYPSEKEIHISLNKISDSSNKEIKNNFEYFINQLLQALGYGEISFKITNAIIQGKNFIQVGSSIINMLPTNTAYSIPGVFEMNLRVRDGQLGWELDGALIDIFIDIGIIPIVPNSL